MRVSGEEGGKVLHHLELSMLLEPNEEPKEFCSDIRRKVFTHTEKRRWWFGYKTIRRFYIVANCTRDAGHKPPHTDSHTGHRWEDDDG